MILREKRSKCQDLISRLRHQSKCMCQRSGRPRCHENMLLAVGKTESLLQIFRNGFSYTGDAETWTVTMQFQGLPGGQHMNHSICKFSGNRNRRISQTIVEYIFISDLLSSCRSEFRKLPDHRFSGQHVFVFLD